MGNKSFFGNPGKLSEADMKILRSAGIMGEDPVKKEGRAKRPVNRSEDLRKAFPNLDIREPDEPDDILFEPGCPCHQGCVLYSANMCQASEKQRKGCYEFQSWLCSRKQGKKKKRGL